MQVSETAKYETCDSFLDLRPLYSIPRKQPCRGPHRGALLFLRIEYKALSPENESPLVAPTARYYGPAGQTGAPFFRALPDLPTPSHQLSN